MKKLSFLLIVFLLSISLSLSGCNSIEGLNLPEVVRGSGNVVTELRPVEGFETVVLNGAGKLVITQGTGEKLLIEAEDNILPKIVTSVENGVLTLGFETNIREDQVIPTKEMVYYLNIVELNGLTINGAATLETNDLVLQGLTLKINGTGKFNLNEIQATRLEVSIDGGADVTVSGLGGDQIIVINGAGQYNAENFQTSSTAITMNGLGDATVWAEDDLMISINGAGGVNYYGDPHVTQNISGVGNVKSLGTK